AIYVLFLTLSLFFADNLDLALNGAFLRCEGYSTLLLYMILFSAARLSGEWQKKQLDLVLLTASLVSLYGIFQYFAIDPFPRDFIRWHWKEIFSTMGNPNFLGTFLVLMLPLAYHNLLESGSKRYLLIYSLLFYCL
ncbi:MAG TPA: hypothetical protein DEP50_05855, partial [Acinetobacter lwoffii]|nr:hypothetical protein [Acinetobacter lwoffii]